MSEDKKSPLIKHVFGEQRYDGDGNCLCCAAHSEQFNAMQTEIDRLKGEIDSLNNKLTGSEAIYGLLGWLTAHPQEVRLGANHTVEPAVGYVDEFCKVNNLAEPRDGWTSRLTMPPYIDVKPDVAPPDQKPCSTLNCHEWIDLDGPDICESCHGINMEHEEGEVG